MIVELSSEEEIVVYETLRGAYEDKITRIAEEEDVDGELQLEADALGSVLGKLAGV